MELLPGMTFQRGDKTFFVRQLLDDGKVEIIADGASEEDAITVDGVPELDDTPKRARSATA